MNWIELNLNRLRTQTYFRLSLVLVTAGNTSEPGYWSDSTMWQLHHVPSAIQAWREFCFELLCCTTISPNAVSKKGLASNSLRGVNVTLRGICYERGVTFARKLSETAQHAVPVSFTLHSFFLYKPTAFYIRPKSISVSPWIRGDMLLIRLNSQEQSESGMVSPLI